MILYGVDFTSAPRRRKPITVVRARRQGDRLEVEAFEDFHEFSAFETFLERQGPWLAAMDFPFFQPRRLIENLGWPEDWGACVERFRRLGSREAFRGFLKSYRDPRPDGDKQHPRKVDALSRSQSPMTVHGTPVGLMFFEGAPRLLCSGCRILPQRREGDPQRTVVEGYPALAARWLAGTGSYKAEQRSKDSADRRKARSKLIRNLQSSRCQERYGLHLSLESPLAEELETDHKADRLDALLCAVQAAWASTRSDLGIPRGVDPLEGWIADPLLAAGPV